MANLVFHINKIGESQENCSICLNGFQASETVAFHKIEMKEHEIENKDMHYMHLFCFEQFIKNCRDNNFYPFCPMDRKLLSDNLVVCPSLQNDIQIQMIKNLLTEAIEHAQSNLIPSEEELAELLQRSMQRYTQEWLRLGESVRRTYAAAQALQILSDECEQLINQIQKTQGCWARFKQFFGYY
jgi:hypothetical protein